MTSKYRIFFIILSLTLLYCFVLETYIIKDGDTQSYIEISKSWDTLLRPIGYPILIRLSEFIDGYKFVILLQVLMCAIIFQVVHTITQSRFAIIALVLTGTYILYVPYLLSDLSFAFFIILAYYYMREGTLGLHFLFLGIASLFKPTLAWFFIAEPFIMWFKFKDTGLMIYSFFMCFIVTSFMPMKNFFEHGVWTHSQILKVSINEYYFSNANNKILYMVYSLFSNAVSTHWNSFFSIFGFQKGVTKELWFNLINWIFALFYSVIWIRFIISSFYNKTFSKLLFVMYFMAPTIFCHSGGGRWRLPFEFLLF